jgi:CRISPR-associated endonuclease Csn1
MKTILGLDLGTNSIGWALIKQDFENKKGEILGMGSRIIPMGQDILGDFDKGNSISQTAERTRLRSIRRLRERQLLRRERLHRVLNILGFLPEHYASDIDFTNKLGKFLPGKEPKIAYKTSLNEKSNQHKYDFIFINSFYEMVKDFSDRNAKLNLNIDNQESNLKIPHDWTIYYLRKKALTQKIEKEELAWLLLNFNQKRGYNQARGEEDETSQNINEFVIAQKIIKITRGEPDKKNNKRTWYTINLENGWEYTAPFTTEPLWLNHEKEFLVAEEIDEHGNIKIVKDKKSDTIGKEKRRITPLPTFEEIELMSKQEQDKYYKKIKVKTEITIQSSGKTVGEYIYDSLLQKPNQKIRGKLVRTIDRKFYKDELKKILEKQIQLNADLFTDEKVQLAINDLYKSNESHRQNISNKGIIHLLIEDILFYQRPLKSKKSSISNCSLEFRRFKTAEGSYETVPVKVIAKSHPLYQEFRVWQWLYNLRILTKDPETDVTQNFLKNHDDYANLFDFLMLQREVNHKDILTYLLTPTIKSNYPGAKPAALNKEIAKEIAKYRWNYVFDDSKEKEDDKSKKYPCNETGFDIRKRLEKVNGLTTGFLTPDKEEQLWHIIYSVSDKKAYEKALNTFALKNKLDASGFIEAFKNFKPFPSDYGAFSLKAIKKLLPLMRIGKYWNWKNISPVTQERIVKILNGEVDESIKTRVREKSIHLTSENCFQGLQLWLASYIVYDRHSEASSLEKWKKVNDLEQYLIDFKQHALRNPIVEQVVTETLRVVKDIWIKYGNSQDDFFKAIHVELGREMKNTAEDRKSMTSKIWENETTNLRIKALLAELKSYADIKDVRPHSPYQQEALRIYEEYALGNQETYDEKTGRFIFEPIPDDILKISNTAQPTKAELQRYKLWLEQKYRSPYTGEMIPLSELFTPAYEIEHIIPQSRYFDDSFSNKVICEAAVNKLKDRQLGMEFIKNHPGEMVETGYGKRVKIYSAEEYIDFVKQHYPKNRTKCNKLLMEEIPDKMIERQLNDTRYISKFISGLLSKLVRDINNDDGVNSKNVLPGNGKVTATLRQDWGLNDVWNDLILPRFERMNKLTNSTAFTTYSERFQKLIPTVPIELSKGFSKKRIDHRHHALDALVIACATRDHINLLNNQHAKSDTKRYDLQRKLRIFEKTTFTDRKTNEVVVREVPKDFIKPWTNFTQEAKERLECIIISFKQNLRIINKTTNRFEKIIDKNGEKTKITVTQTKGESWAVRKPLHKDTVSGKVELARIKVPKGKILTATRKPVDTSFDYSKIESITDTGIQKILKNYLKSKNDNPEIAFSPEGLDYLNKNITLYNDGKKHLPIIKVRVFEAGSKFPLGQTGNKKYKYVEAAKGTNLFFAIYEDKKGGRNYDTIPLNIVVERLKQGLSSVPEINEKGDKLLFYLSPNDLVYVPTESERENPDSIAFSKMTSKYLSRIFVVNDFSTTCYFTPNVISKNIAPKEIDLNFDTNKNKLTGSYDTKTASFEGKQIKDVCIKLKVDRLGKIMQS